MKKRNGKNENPAKSISPRIIEIIELKQREGFLKYVSLPLLKAVTGTLALITIMLAMQGSRVLAAVCVGLIILSMYVVGNFKKQLRLTQKLIEEFLSGGVNEHRKKTQNAEEKIGSDAKGVRGKDTGKGERNL